MLALALCTAAPVQTADLTRGPGGVVTAPDGSQAGRQLLFAIGVDEYQRLPDLRSAVHDAQAVRDVCRQHYVFDDVIELYNSDATRKAILGRFDEWARTLSPEDSLFIYYAGHGYQDPILKTGFWMPHDAQRDDRSTWVANMMIKRYLNQEVIKAKHILLVSDSCFAGDFFSESRVVPTIDSAYHRQAYAKTSRQAITSGGLEPVADGPFAVFFVRALKENRQPYLVPGSIFERIKEGVALSPVKQTPLLGYIRGTNSEMGEFVFFRRGAGPVVEPPTAIERPTTPVGAGRQDQPALTETSGQEPGVSWLPIAVPAAIALLILGVAAKPVIKWITRSVSPPPPPLPPMDAAKLVVPLPAGPSRKIFLFGKRHVTFGREGTEKGTNDISLRLLPTGETDSPNWKATEKMSRNQGVFECRDDGLYLRKLGAKGLSVDGQPMAASEMKLPDDCCVSVAGVLDLRTKAHRDPSTDKLTAARISRVENAENHEYVILAETARIGPEPQAAISLSAQAEFSWQDGIFALKPDKPSDLLVDGKRAKCEATALRPTQNLDLAGQPLEFHAITPEDFKTL